MSVLPHNYKQSLLLLEDVSLVLGGKLILRDVNAEIRDVTRPDLIQGQVVAILGPSGIGKSQLLHLIAGLKSPTSGNVLVPFGDPKDCQFQKVSRGHVGMVFQNYALFEHRTVYGNLSKAAALGAQETRARWKLAEIVERFKLGDHLRRFPAELSGGQRQRVAIAQQLLCGETLLLMDEPFSGLDIQMEAEVCKLIVELSTQDELNTILLVTHDVTAACSVADHVWMLGRDRDYSKGSEGAIIPGARIVAELDLIEQGLCWNPDITQSKEFTDFVRDVKARFLGL